MRVGPNFWNEIIDAGLLGAPFTVMNGEVREGDLIAPEQSAALRAVLAAHDPMRPRRDQYAVDRAAAYEREIGMGEQLDAIRKHLATQPPTPGLTDVLDKVAAIKARFPKP